MKHRFNIENILKNAVAARGIPYLGILVPGLDKTKIPLLETDYSIEMGDMEEMHTPSGSLLRDSETGFYLPVQIGGVMIPHAVLSLSQSKIIVKTQMPGVNGSVKELISLDDINLTIVGVIVADDPNYPEQKMVELKELWAKNEALEIISVVTDIMMPTSDTKIVITDITLDPVAGYENIQTFSITAISDTQLILTEE